MFDTWFSLLKVAVNDTVRRFFTITHIIMMYLLPRLPLHPFTLLLLAPLMCLSPVFQLLFLPDTLTEVALRLSSHTETLAGSCF